MPSTGGVPMKTLVAAFKALKSVVTGEVVSQLDSRANNGTTTMSVRLKKNPKSGTYYVVLAQLSSGNYQYVSFTVEEFGQFADSVNVVRESLGQHLARAIS
jgi:hypothetical protein